MARLVFEIKREAVITELPCNKDDCNGFFRHTGFCDTSKGSCEYQHKCSECGHYEIVVNQTYPKIDKKRL